ncbi:TRAP transporter small permease subunit [Pollutimonas thiosulfatoxidans]|uniref:TRAP transporter small permease protein n=1 Tax=Pollutimonas thiosulfatoxidans TaxID=2028345 RepID=A0A410GE80_9BURK|nr:TRAP transporter small permease [Pollutimonas thiosulfatoxidans]NYT44260.1 TRAP transporter small permease [Alcaligenaceae bacterium]QAA94575.1 hypothetical protein CKA81_12595 [Pollutimonas thiosulfatoxidans]
MQPQEPSSQPHAVMPQSEAHPPEGPIERAVGKLNEVIGEGSGYLYFLVFAICLMEILLRFFFNSPTTWAFEVTIALCGIQYCLAGGNAHRLGRHIRIDAIYLAFPLRLRKVFDVVGEVIISLVVSSIVYGSGVQALRALSAWQTTGSAFDSPAPTFMKLAIPIGAFLILLQSLVNLRRAFIALRRGNEK